MLNQKSLDEFKNEYCTSLTYDPITNGYFIKVPISDYSELNIIKTNLLSAINLINRYHEMSDQSEKGDVIYSTATIVQLLRSFGLEDECEGITKLMTESKGITVKKST